MGPNRICWATVERWKRDLVAGDYREIRAAFLGDGVAAPRILWAPRAEDLPTPPMAAAHRYWDRLRGSCTMPHHGEVDPLGFVPALGYVNILETVDGTCDLRYRLFGSIAAKISGFDMTGRLQSEHPASRYVAEFALAGSNACIARGEPLFTEREPARAEHTFRWPRLVLPLRGDRGGVARLMTVTVPLDANRNVIR